MRVNTRYINSTRSTSSKVSSHLCFRFFLFFFIYFLDFNFRNSPWSTIPHRNHEHVVRAVQNATNRPPATQINTTHKVMPFFTSSHLLVKLCCARLFRQTPHERWKVTWTRHCDSQWGLHRVRNLTIPRTESNFVQLSTIHMQTRSNQLYQAGFGVNSIKRSTGRLPCAFIFSNSSAEMSFKCTLIDIGSLY